ncbi:MAG: FG-GAP repeat protein, partial [Chloroflexi bacterium]|nr:FG-GAP repeat protein [Chloroflexota bacterium]
MTRHISRTVGNIHTMPRSLLILALLVALVAWVATGSGVAEAVPPNFGDVIESKLTVSDGAAGGVFGFSVAISGDTAVVGAFRDDGNRGSAYVYEAQPTHRQLKASLDAIEAKLDGLDLDDLDKEVSQIERKVLEDALVRGDLYPLLATPVTVDSQGKLEEVLAVVGKSIVNFNAMGLA